MGQNVEFSIHEKFNLLLMGMEMICNYLNAGKPCLSKAKKKNGLCFIILPWKSSKKRLDNFIGSVGDKF